METCRAEFMVEPFEIGNPSPHVLAAFEAAKKLGFDAVISPIGTTIEGEPGPVIATVKQLQEQGAFLLRKSSNTWPM